ncbi:MULTISPECIES: PEP-CTERM sorting domain-containing protein [unclassified Roseateles]|uniref:PEP-CTERM sorting domain-containing protein n=1 Tax=unclassified Roseateles TaxID=2626991 RepID=UPI0006F43E0E|nr:MULTISPECIES: PEP-CTERM sorting domain-containing protein [unclassified Roseateles]KQW41954.1 hypothetical protein ASC81_21815 [Pelomonas sp. Root405]KRA67557.1 hypothetical protein ASD88_23400 [Pelomonas sp. Root662]
MKVFARILSAAALVGCTGAYSPALAGAAGYATIQGLKFTLVDLDGQDGVAPMLTRIDDPNASMGGTELFLPSGSWSAAAPFETLSASSTDANQRTTAYIGSDSAGVTMASTSGYVSADAIGTVRASTVPPEFFGFVLTPNTSLLIEAELHTAVAAAVPSWRGDWANGMAEISLFRPSPLSGTATIVGAARASASAGWNLDIATNPEVGYDESFLAASILFTHHSDQPIILGFRYQTSLSSVSNTPTPAAIPEPSSWLLLALGLLALGAKRASNERR